ncbi:unnamed protein product, partial [Polarella glacialis]
ELWMRSSRLQEFSDCALDELRKLQSLLPCRISYLQNEAALGSDDEGLEVSKERKLLPSELRLWLAQLEEFLLTNWFQSLQAFSRSLPPCNWNGASPCTSQMLPQRIPRSHSGLDELQANENGDGDVAHTEIAYPPAHLADMLHDFLESLRKLRLRL